MQTQPPKNAHSDRPIGPITRPIMIPILGHNSIRRGLVRDVFPRFDAIHHPASFPLPNQMRIHARQRPFPKKHPLHILHRQPLEPDPRLHRPAAVMARHGHVLHLRQPRTDVRFVGMDIQSHGREMPGFKRIGQGVFFDEAAAGDVHEAGAAGEESDKPFREEGAAGESGGRGEEEAVGFAEHVLHIGVEGCVDCSFLLRGFADDVVVYDLHAESGVGFLRDDEADVAEADDAEGVVAGVAGDGGDVVVGVLKAGGGGGAGGEGGPGHGTEDGDDVVEGHVADGFGGGAGAVAVEDACEVSNSQHGN